MPPERQRFDTIDLLRGLSILAVILLHGALRLRFAGYTLEPDLPRWLYHLLFWNGNNGVTVFFAVSGFLITHGSIRRFGSLANVPPGVFYRFRFARIAPLLLALLAVLSLLHLAGAEGFVIKNTSLGRALLSALTFHLNWLEAKAGYLPAAWDVLWSLSVEEMFYLVFPLACLMVRRGRAGYAAFLVFLCAFAAAGPFARTVWANNEIWQEKSYLGGMDGIALGCLSAILTHARQGRRLPAARLVEAAGWAALLLVALWPRWSWLRVVGRAGLDGTILAVGACLIMMPTTLAARPGGVIGAPLRWLGRHSYEVYLTHEFLIIWGTMLHVRWPVLPLGMWFALSVAVSAAVGAAVARWFTEPLRLWCLGRNLRN